MATCTEGGLTSLCVGSGGWPVRATAVVSAALPGSVSTSRTGKGGLGEEHAREEVPEDTEARSIMPSGARNSLSDYCDAVGEEGTHGSGEMASCAIASKAQLKSYRPIIIEGEGVPCLRRDGETVREGGRGGRL